MAIKDTPQDQRPREKLLRLGAPALSDTELLALLLRTGHKGHDVFALSADVLQRFGGFAGLLNSKPDVLRQVKGLGPAKRAEISAVMEMCRRALAQQMQASPVMDSPKTLHDFVSLKLAARQEEVFAAMYLDNHQRMLTWDELFHGTLNHTSVHPRVLVRRAIETNAAFVVVAHNHPSGVAEPSPADQHLTRCWCRRCN
jgi:DNA repair protein RadC